MDKNVSKVRQVQKPNSYLSIGNTAYIILTDKAWLVGLLNSKLIWLYYQNISSIIRSEFVRFISQYMEIISISGAIDVQKATIIELARVIQANPDIPDITRLEAEIKNLVY